MGWGVGGVVLGGLVGGGGAVRESVGVVLTVRWWCWCGGGVGAVVLGVLGVCVWCVCVGGVPTFLIGCMCVGWVGWGVGCTHTHMYMDDVTKPSPSRMQASHGSGTCARGPIVRLWNGV